jgi:hypothetical protein
MEHFTGLSNLPHQDRRGFEIPVRIGDVAMAEIGAECDDVAGDSLPIGTTGFQGPHGKAVPEVVDPGAPLTRRTS